MAAYSRRVIDLDEIGPQIEALLHRVGTEELLPRLASAAATAEMKSPGEVVTVADRAAEAALIHGLEAITPTAAIIGEESAHADPRLLDGLGEHKWAWLVDPLDGTRQFAAGTGPFGIMLALLHRGHTEAAWIHLPLTRDMACARRGGGTRINGDTVRMQPAPKTGLRGGLLTRFLPEPMKSRADSSTIVEHTEGAHHCAAQRYVDTLRGTEHFAVYWRTLAWDHAPGALLIEEAGGLARRFDGSPYAAPDLEGTSLLVAADEHTWGVVHDDVLGLA